MASVFGWAAVVIGAGETALGAVVFSKWVREIEIGAIFCVSVCLFSCVGPLPFRDRLLRPMERNPSRSPACCSLCWSTTVPRTVASSHGTASPRLLLPVLVHYHPTTTVLRPTVRQSVHRLLLVLDRYRPTTGRFVPWNDIRLGSLCWFTASHETTSFSRLLLLVLVHHIS